MNNESLSFLSFSCFNVFNKHLLSEECSKKLSNIDNIFTDADFFPE